ncbi:hypothetical protein [Aequorivita marina]|uniref:hypothetical protein n=1 Tax=Aequorivita marina TaxID=3073654 RepID=UPI002874BF18|nr:hypothetical protein [Aequorivita sp. S2608]MDS1299598.1 hypothetical protein [Aequorivita sp. S2608]
MELIKIEKLLDAYFEGTTSLSEEKLLQDYFNTEKVADHLIQYKPIFIGLKAARTERYEHEIRLPDNKSKPNKTWWYSVAAMLVISLGVAGFYFAQPQYSQEEKEALAAFEKSKRAMLFLSENLNKGTEQLTFVEQFKINKNKVFE